MHKLVLLLALLSLAATPQTTGPSASGPNKAVRYTILMAGNKAGFETSGQDPDGRWQLYYEFNDRGRGPVTTERIELDKAGLPVNVETTGIDYYKAPISERFSLRDGNASWKNRAEQSQKQLSAPAFYISISGAPEERAILARALLAAPGGKLPLLPGGEASIEKRGELKIEAGGKSRTVIQYAINGLDFTPTPIWLDPDGTFFAVASSWFSVVQEGWESTAETLTKTQDEFDRKRTADLATSLGQKPGVQIFIHANLFDSETATLRKNVNVILVGNTISRVDDKLVLPPRHHAQVIDATNQTLMPGLWDMHVHMGPNDGLLHMAAGVTTVRDMANDTAQLLEMRSRFDQNIEIGPRILMAGILDGSGPFAGPTKVLVDNEDEARDAIDKYARLGYVQIKIYSSIKPELVPKIVAMAHSHGLRVSGHVPAFMNAEQFVGAGVDEIQHMNFIFLNFMFDRVKDTRGPARFSEVAAHGAEIDPNSPQVKAFIQLMLDHKVDLDPTLAIFEDMFTSRPGQVSPSYAAVADRMPAQIRRGFFYGGLDVPEGMDQRYQDSFAQMLKMAKAFYDAGIPLVAGTDGLAGFTLQRELELYAKAGIPAPKVLQLATLGAARVMKRDQDLGSITPGKLADMILIDGDPTTNISDIRKVRMVIKDGMVYKTEDLYRALGVQP
jgi:imidazolonepropionase-like amidohydrolase